MNPSVESIGQKIIDSAIERDVQSLPREHALYMKELLWDVDGEDVGRYLNEKWDNKHGEIRSLVVESPIDDSAKYIEVVFAPRQCIDEIEETVARGIIKLALMGGEDVGTHVITVPLDGASARGVAFLLYGFQRIIDKISIPKRGNEITVVFA